MPLIIHRKNGYSDRKGITNYKDTIQYESFDSRTRNKLYNLFNSFIQRLPSLPYDKFVKYLYCDLFSLTVDDIPINSYTNKYDNYYILKVIKKIILNSAYNELLDLLEGTEEFLQLFYSPICDSINKIFEEEGVQHRMVCGEITDITNKYEIAEIEKIVEEGSVASVHIQKAINLLYDRDSPDYKNSIKESISAVEAICCNILGNKNATLAEALKKLESEGFVIHAALKEGFLKIYGYTSDADGIRHANGMGEDTNIHEARYMLISCSAFINYLISSNPKAGK